MRESSSVAYVEPGSLLFGRNGVLLAQRFDVKRIQTLGDPARIVDTLETASGHGYSFSVSSNGVLIYWTGKRFSAAQLTWYRRDGTRLASVGPVGPFRSPRISPDGRAIAVNRLESEDDFSVCLIDSRGVPTRFTFGDYDLNPIWAPDGASIIFSSPRDGLPPNPFQKTWWLEVLRNGGSCTASTTALPPTGPGMDVMLCI